MVTLYRFYSADRRLLYVGVTGTGQQRVRSHAAKAKWWDQVASATFEHDRTLDDERTAIELERPLYNVDHTDRADWVDAVHEAMSEGRFTDRALIEQAFDRTVQLRDRLAGQLAEVERRLDLLAGADRSNRRLRRSDHADAEG